MSTPRNVTTATSRTPAMLFYEYCIHHNKTPEYKIEEDVASSDLKKFICTITCDENTAAGEGRTKKKAKQAAAKKMLELMKIVDEAQHRTNSTTIPFLYEGRSDKDFVKPLEDFCIKYGFQAPEYLDVRSEGPPNACVFTSRCTIASLQTEAIGNTKKRSRHLASMHMLTRLNKMVDRDTYTKLELPDISFIDPSQEPDYRKASTLLNNGTLSDFRKNLAGDFAHPLSSDYVQFKNIFPEDLEVYEEIKPMLLNYHEQNAFTTLISVLDKSDYNYALIPIESIQNVCSIILTVDCSPNLNVLETGNSYVEACYNIATKTLEYMKILYFSRERCSVEHEQDIEFETLINVEK